MLELLRYEKCHITNISTVKKKADRERDEPEQTIFISIYFVHILRKICVYSAIKFFIEYFRGRTSHSAKSLYSGNLFGD